LGVPAAATTPNFVVILIVESLYSSVEHVVA
jgi:hypothetical protein